MSHATHMNVGELSVYVVWGHSGYVPLVFDIWPSDEGWHWQVFAGFEPEDIHKENLLEYGVANRTEVTGGSLADLVDAIIDAWLYSEDTGYLPDWMKG